MSNKNATLRFFSDLEHVSAEIVGSDSAVAIAARNAIEQATPAAFVQAQEELAGLSEDVRDDVLNALHARMRNDVAAIWDNLPNSPKTDRAN